MSEAIDEKKYKRLRKEVEDAKAEADRAQGALDQLTARLKEEFECESVEEAKKKLSKLKKAKDKAEADFEEAMKDYEAKWKGEDADEQ